VGRNCFLDVAKEVKYAGKYVYCVMGSGERKSFGTGLGGKPVYTIPYRDISAVVSDTPIIEYEPNEVNVIQQEKVVENVMREHTVLPLGFGSVFVNEDRVRFVLARFYQTFKVYLNKLENKVEVGVKVFYDVEAMKREIEKTNDEVKRLKEEITSKPDEETHLLKEKLNIIIEGEALRVASERAYQYGVEVYEALKKCAEDTYLMKRIGGDMILNGAFLIHKDKICDFERELEKIKKKYESKELKFQYSGPWPPYNFARIHIGK
jgi:hypothetical protein